MSDLISEEHQRILSRMTPEEPTQTEAHEQRAMRDRSRVPMGAVKV